VLISPDDKEFCFFVLLMVVTFLFVLMVSQARHIYVNAFRINPEVEQLFKEEVQKPVF